MLWHIFNIYAAHGFRDFIVACGYKGEVIKEYFRNFVFHDSDVTVDLRQGKIEVANNRAPDWRVTLVDTGATTQTGGRIKRCQDHIEGQTFMATYGDGVGNVDITSLVRFHRAHKKLATVTAVRPPSRFGALILDGQQVVEFNEKPQTGEGWINGGFFVFEPAVLDLLGGDEAILELEPLQKLARDGQLAAFRHEGFWQPMDTIREKQQLEALWENGQAPWKVW